MKKLIIVLSLLLSLSVFAANDVYIFNSAQEKNRFDTLTRELRCLVCQNQSLAESNAPLANDLRLQVYEKLKAGKTNKEIVQYLVERYGDFILYNPPVKPNTAVLWFAPFFLITFGLLIVLLYVSKQKQRKLREPEFKN